MAKDSFWGEFIPDEELVTELLDSQGEYQGLVAKEKVRRKEKRRKDKENEVGSIPDPLPEILEQRERYRADYTLVHPEIYPNSTGIKPLSKSQEDAVRHSQFFVQHGTHILKCEPRGFGKTSRSTNEGLFGVLQGDIKYLVIVASNTEKAEEIITSVMTELMTNTKLFELYPKTLACFRHTEKNPRRSLSQTYEGNPTYIYYNNGFIVFPYIDGEPSSGCIIDIRARKNVRGIYHTIETGEFAGTRQRPTHAILDDIQIDEEATNPNTARKIVNLIKRSIMMAGGHDSGISIMMNGTPIAPGDVTHHFLFNEPWQHVIYKMLLTRSKNEDMWFGTYQETLLDFDKTIPGSKLQAALKALEYYRANFAAMNEGAEAAWDWCYKWREKIQVEIHAIQHAYNIMILEGMDVFEAECQCNVSEASIDETITYCSANQVANNIHERPRYALQVKDRHIISHIDVNKPYLSYMTVSSGDIINPQIIDYNTYPEYPLFPEKGKVAYTLASRYHKEDPNLLPEDITYMAVRDLIRELARRRYKREDGVDFPNHLILVDSRYHTEWVYKAVRDSGIPNAHPCQGQSFKAKDKSIAQMKYSDASIKYHKTVLTPTDDRTLMRLTVDVNYMKTQAHICFARPPETAGAASLFIPESTLGHLPVGRHFTAEQPYKDIDPRTGNEVTIWQERPGGGDNELFDNFVGCLGGLSMRGVKFKVQSAKPINATYDINTFLSSQKANR